jgi:hypothetical protein
VLAFLVEAIFNNPRGRRVTNPSELTEEQAHDLAWQAVELAGGTRAVYRNPKYAFSLQQAGEYLIDGHKVEVRHGEISSPAIVTVKGWIFEVLDEEIELLMRPPKPRSA